MAFLSYDHEPAFLSLLTGLTEALSFAALVAGTSTVASLIVYTKCFSCAWYSNAVATGSFSICVKTNEAGGNNTVVVGYDHGVVRFGRRSTQRDDSGGVALEGSFGI